MGYYYIYATIIAVIILNFNFASLLKNVKKGEETFLNTIIGSVCSLVIILSICQICEK